MRHLLTDEYQEDNKMIKIYHNLCALTKIPKYMGTVLISAQNHLKLQLLVALIIVSSLVLGIPGQSVTAAGVSGHPRLYFTQEDLIALKALKTAPSHQAIWNAIKSWADDHTGDTPPSSIGSDSWDMSGHVKQYLVNMGFVYVMTGTAAYADAAKRWALAVAGWTDWEGDGGPSLYPLTASIISTGISFTYDVLYDYLTAAERGTIRNAIVTKMDPIYQKYVVIANPFPDYPNGACFVADGLGIAGLSLEGDYESANNWINLAKNMAQAAIKNGKNIGSCI
jgi:hypothetical protein